MEELSPSEDLIRERLEKLGATLTKAHYTGDSSFPTEYTIRYKNASVVHATLDLVLVALIERLIKDAS